MKRDERVQQILSGFNSFKKSSYKKSEVLPELLKLQKEIVRAAFPNTAEEKTSEFRLWDVVDQLQKDNETLGAKASEEIERFRDDCKLVGNMIAAEISGSKGENRAYKRLINSECPGIILRNLEIEKEGERTEIDLTIIHPGGVSFVEVKNTRKNVFIDEQGNQYRSGKYTRFDSPLRQKMDLRKRLLEEAIEKSSISGIEAKGIVVFTDNRIEIENECRELDVCLLSQLPYKVTKGNKSNTLSLQEQNTIAETLVSAAQERSYPINLDISKIKTDFAKALVAIEEANTRRANPLRKMRSWIEKLLVKPGRPMHYAPAANKEAA